MRKFILKSIINFVALLLSTFYIVNTYNKFNLISIGSNIDKVKKSWGRTIFSEHF